MNSPKFIWIIGESKIEIIFDTYFEVKKSDIKLFDYDNNFVGIHDLESYDDCIVVNTSAKLDFSKNYYIVVGEQSLNAYYKRSMLNSHFTTDLTMGAKFTSEGISLNFWSPISTQVALVIYDKNDKHHEVLTESMTRNEQGVWSIQLNNGTQGIEDFHGYYYQLERICFGQKIRVLDPYAKSMEAHQKEHGVNHLKGVFIDLERTNPPNYKTTRLNNKDIMSDRADFLAQEIHVRDFTISHTSKLAKKERGTYIGFTKKINYLKDLGISHVQFMPIQSFYTVDETNRRFQDEKVPTELINYNWGYDTHHYFIPSGWYSSDAENPVARIFELKKMIMELHSAGIGAVLDVVYNHNYSRHFLEDVAPGCYLRRTRQGYISTETGAGDSIETRTEMVRKLIVDSLKYYMEEFHFNGFRFDLMGFMDKKTTEVIRESLGKDVILYGEAWEFTDIHGDSATTKRNLPHTYEVGTFNDSTRNSYVGEKGSQAFVQGNYGLGPLAKTGITAAIQNYNTDYNKDGHLDAFIDQFSYHAFAYEPSETINYLSIHDGHTLWDKINISSSEDIYYKEKMHKLAIAMLLTSQGRIVLESGSELFRSKPLAPNDPNKHRAHHSPNLKFREYEENTALHENTYKSPDLTNMYNWDNLEHYGYLFDYVQGLISIRKKFSCLRYETAEEINKGLRFHAENIPNTPTYTTQEGTRHSSWDHIKELTIEFINGPINQTLYLIGEIHPKRLQQKNPRSNDLILKFDMNGKAEISFTEEQIRAFDFGGWGFDDSLKVKLVKTPGEWDFPQSSYSRLGTNKIFSWSINNATNRATVDLAIQNHTSGEGVIKMNPYIAYSLECKDNPGHLIVVHNSHKQYQEIEIPHLSKYENHDILADHLLAQTTKLSFTAVEIVNGVIRVPGKSSAIVHCY